MIRSSFKVSRIRVFAVIGVTLIISALVISASFESGNQEKSPDSKEAPPPSSGDIADREPLPDSGKSGNDSEIIENMTTIKGLVVDVNSNVLAGAKLSMTASDPLLNQLLKVKLFSETRSEADGSFVLDRLKSGIKYTLNVQLEGYRVEWLESEGNRVEGMMLEVPPDGISDAKVVMQQVGEIEGKVVDMAGSPLAGVIVGGAYQNKKNDPPNTWAFVEPSKTTGKNGFFRLSGVPSGDINLYALKYMESSKSSGEIPMAFGDESNPLKTIPLAPGETKSGIVLILPVDPTKVVEGRVEDMAGKPVAGAQVVLTDPVTFRVVGAVDEKTPDTGVFRITGIQEAAPKTDGGMDVFKMRLVASCPGYMPETIEDISVGMRNIRIIMEPVEVGTLSCRLYDAETRDTIRDASIFLGTTEITDYDTSRDKGVRPGLLGWATIENIPAGRVDIVITATGYGLFVKENIPLSPGKTTELEIPLSRAGLLCTRILAPEKFADGSPVGGSAIIAVIPAETPENSRSAYQCTRMIENNKAPSTALKCSGSEEKPPSSHRDLELAPGIYDVTMDLSVGQSGVINDALPSYHLSNKKRVEIMGGEVTSLVWDVVNDNQDRSGMITIDLQDLAGEKCYLILKERGFSERVSESANAPDDTGVFYITGTQEAAFTIPMIPPGDYNLSLSTKERSIYHEPPLGSLNLRINSGDHVEISREEFSPINKEL